MIPTLSKLELHRALQLSLRGSKLRLSSGATRELSSLVSLAAKTLAQDPALLAFSRSAPETVEEAAVRAEQNFGNLLREAHRYASLRTSDRKQALGLRGFRGARRATIQAADIQMALRSLCPLWPVC